MRLAGIVAAAVLAAAFFLALVLVPAPHADLPPAGHDSGTVIAGVFHVHTRRSDGSGSPDEIAAAAARAGLQFVIFSDHGDGTRVAAPPAYRSGVLCIDAVELSTAAGHYVALDLPRAPYPLRGEPRDVVEDVARLGGFGIVAHPASPNPRLRWGEWTPPLDGIEWLNGDSEWRDERGPLLLGALLAYPFRPAAALAGLLDRPEVPLQRWDELTRRRMVVGLAAADAHSRLGWSEDDGEARGGAMSLHLPSYLASFREFANRAILLRPLSGDARADGRALLDAIRAGRVFAAIDAIGSPVTFDFTALTLFGPVPQGARVQARSAATLRVRVTAPGATIVLLRNGAALVEHTGPELAYEAPAASGVYRVEVRLPNAPGRPPIPWIVSNPIYLEPARWGSEAATPVAPASDSRGIQGGPWHVEAQRGSTGVVSQETPPDGPVRFSYTLAPGNRTGQYAALGIGVGDALSNRSRLAFRARSDAPMRISVQARRPAGERWQRSVFLNTSSREIVIPYADMRAVEGVSAAFVPREIDSLLFVVDTTNTAPGSSGAFEIEDLRIER